MSQPPDWSIYIPKKRQQGQELEDLKTKRRKLFDQEQQAKKDIKARGLFGEDFFRSASRAESLTLARLRATSAISYSNFQGDIDSWVNEEAVQELFLKMRAAEYRVISYQQHSDALAAQKKKKFGRFRPIFMKLFTSARVGLDINGVGEGPRNKSQQGEFRAKLIEDCDAANGSFVWCPILQKWYRKECMRAAHLFSYKHGQDIMDEIFGKIRPSEMFSSRNGILIHSTIENEFDKGYFAIVPDVTDATSMDKIRTWLTGETREYKLRILDWEWNKLDEGINEIDGLTWREADNRRLVFRNNTRPAARYLYFHYCLQVLRRAWKVSPDKKNKDQESRSQGQSQADCLYEEFDKYVWATPGRYIGRKMLRALVDTLGQQYKGLMRGASMSAATPGPFMHALTAQIGTRPDHSDETEDETDSESGMDLDSESGMDLDED